MPHVGFWCRWWHEPAQGGFPRSRGSLASAWGGPLMVLHQFIQIHTDETQYHAPERLCGIRAYQGLALRAVLWPVEQERRDFVFRWEFRRDRFGKRYLVEQVGGDVSPAKASVWVSVLRVCWGQRITSALKWTGIGVLVVRRRCLLDQEWWRLKTWNGSGEAETTVESVRRGAGPVSLQYWISESMKCSVRLPFRSMYNRLEAYSRTYWQDNYLIQET